MHNHLALHLAESSRAEMGSRAARVERITVEGEAAPVLVKLAIWVPNTRARQDKLTQDQRDALTELSIGWA
nr:hypothetical protein OG781_04460 [Streptomyces sp. NBC_00830]